jgi:hypothetical protein
MSKRSRSRSKILEADGKGSGRSGHGRWFSADMMSNGSTMEVTKPEITIRKAFTAVQCNCNLQNHNKVNSAKNCHLKIVKTSTHYASLCHVVKFCLDEQHH